MYILQSNGIVETLIENEANIPESISDKVIFVEGDIPQIESLPGKNCVFKYDSTNNSVYVEYVDRTLTAEEQARQEIESLKAQNAQMILVMVEGGLL